MKFVIAVHGTRGDVEPAAAVALELQRRGHEIKIAVPPNLIGFARAAGLTELFSYGPDSQSQLEAEVFRTWYKLRNPIKVLQQAREYLIAGWADMNRTVAALAESADLLVSGTTYQELVANVAEARGIPFAAMHYFPLRANNQILPVRLPMGLVNPIWSLAEWSHWRLLKPAYDEQRRTLGLAESRIPAAQRIVENGALEIQAYDKALFPGLDQHWRGKRPLVGAMTLQMETGADSSVNSWIESGRPPIYFGFGSMPVDNATELFALIVNTCRDLGERALICTGILPLPDSFTTPDLMMVASVNHAEVFPRCRAIVHHGGAGTTAASLRSGAPTLVLWIGADQPVWARQIKRLGAGTSRRLSGVTRETLRSDLLFVLNATCAEMARAVAGQMTPPDRSLTCTADLLEAKAARQPLTGAIENCRD